MGVYLLDAANEYPGSFQSSVVISTDKLEREDDEQGEPAASVVPVDETVGVGLR